MPSADAAQPAMSKAATAATAGAAAVAEAAAAREAASSAPSTTPIPNPPIPNQESRQHTAEFVAAVEERLNEWSTSMYASSSYLHEIGATARQEERERTGAPRYSPPCAQARFVGGGRREMGRGRSTLVLLYAHRSVLSILSLTLCTAVGSMCMYTAVVLLGDCVRVRPFSSPHHGQYVHAFVSCYTCSFTYGWY